MQFRDSQGNGRSSLSDNALLHGALLVILCILAYINSFHVPFQFDDVYNIAEKPYVRNIWLFFDASSADWFSSDHGFRMRTVGYFTFALNYLVGGNDVVGYHIGNLLIHCLNGLLVYSLVVWSFRGPVLAHSSLRDSSKSIALFSALLFALHPVQTQAVTYIVQRLTSLATGFYLLGLVSYVKSRLVYLERSSLGKAAPWYGLSLLSAALAMKTKEIAFTLPVVIALYEFLFFRGKARNRVLLLVPLVLTMGIIPFGLIGAHESAGELLGDVSRSMRVDSPLTRWEYLLTETRVVVTYLRLLVLPFGQNLDYDYPIFRSFLNIEVILSFLLLAFLAGAGIRLVFRDRKTLSGARFVSFGIFWFFITLSVESSVIPITDVIFEHRLYLPSVGFWIAVTTALFWGTQRIGKSLLRRILLVGLSVVVLLFSGATYARNRVWGSEVNLWEDVVRKSPEKARGYNSLGFALRKRGRLAEAIEEYREAIRLKQDYALAHHNLAYAYFASHAYDKAVEQYGRAIRLQPDFAEAHNGLGIVYGEMGLMEKAIEQYRIAIRLKPDSANAYTNLGNAYWRLEDVDGAFEQYQMAIRIRPDFPEPFNNLGVIYATRGHPDKAVEYFETAVRLSPANPEYRRNWKKALSEQRGQ